MKYGLKHSNSGFILIQTLFLVSTLCLGIGCLCVLMKLQITETLNRGRALQVEALARTGWKLAEAQWTTLPSVTPSVSKSTLLKTGKIVWRTPYPNQLTLYLAKSQNAVYSVCISQSGQYQASYKKTVQETAGHLTWGALEKW